MSTSDISIEAFERHIAVTKAGRTAQTYARGAHKLMSYMGKAGLSDDPTTWPNALLDDWVAWLVQSKLSGNTIKLMVVGGRLYLRFWRKRDNRVPEFETPAIPKVDTKNPVVLGRGALRTYLEMVADEEDEPVRTAMLLLPLTGLRSEEMVSMAMSRITVQPDPDSPDRTWVVFDVIGKGNKKRVVPLLQEANGFLRAYLSSWRSHQREQDDWLFPGARKGTHVTTRTLREHISDFRLRHGIHELTPHNLRSTYLTMLDRHGISSLTVAQLAGHMRPAGRTELQTLRKHYVHHDVPDLMRALAKVRV